MGRVEQETEAIHGSPSIGEAPSDDYIDRRPSKLRTSIAVALGALAVAAGAEKLGKHSEASPVASPPPPTASYNVFPSATDSMLFQSQSTTLPRKWVGAPLGRTTGDRPDEKSGSQVKLIYAVPSDGVDRQLDTNGTIEADWWNAQDELAGKADRLSFRTDTYGNRLDIGYLELPYTSDFMRKQNSYIVYSLSEQLKLKGYNREDKKYLVFYDGPTERVGGGVFCGASHWPPEIPGNVAVVNTYDAICGLSGNPSTNYGNAVVVHEHLHLNSYFPKLSPRHDSNNPGHTTDSADILNTSAISPDWQIDPGHDDYWNSLVLNDVEPNHNQFSLSIQGVGSVEADQTPVKLLSPEGNACSGNCVLWFGKGALVGLVATPEADSWRFKAWNGDCQGNDGCAVEVVGDKSVNAVFEPIGDLDVSVRKPAMGTVRVAGQGVCRKVCNYEMLAGSKANLVAQPARGSRFTGWQKACAAEKKLRCSVPIRHGKHTEVTAVFTKATS